MEGKVSKFTKISVDRELMAKLKEQAGETPVSQYIRSLAEQVPSIDTINSRLENMEFRMDHFNEGLKTTVKGYIDEGDARISKKIDQLISELNENFTGYNKQLKDFATLLDSMLNRLNAHEEALVRLGNEVFNSDDPEFQQRMRKIMAGDPEELQRFLDEDYPKLPPELKEFVDMSIRQEMEHGR